MHLMYTLDANGTRIYTLKVSLCASVAESLTFMNASQKITESGKITKSAHPGKYGPRTYWYSC